MQSQSNHAGSNYLESKNEAKEREEPYFFTHILVELVKLEGWCVLESAKIHHEICLLLLWRCFNNASLQFFAGGLKVSKKFSMNFKNRGQNNQSLFIEMGPKTATKVPQGWRPAP